MKQVPIFIASSIREFEREREQISVYLDILNDVHRQSGTELVWKRPETMSEAYYFGGTQRQFDREILNSRFFILIVGKRLGEHTEDEFRLALKQFQETGAPVLLFYFLDVFPDMKVQTFRDKLRKLDAQYVNTYQNFDQILNKLHIELIRHGAFLGDLEPSSDEETAQKGQDAARNLIQEQQRKIEELQAQPVTPQIIAELTDAYEELRRLVQTYKVEPNALLPYLDFLWEQRLYDTGIELGRWLENFYQMEPPDDYILAYLNDTFGMCYHRSNQYGRAEEYYRKALEIWRDLAEANPSIYELCLASTFGNLGVLFCNMKRMEDAEKCYRKEMEIYRRLLGANSSAYATACYNLGILLFDMNRKEEAEKYCMEALKIRWFLAEANPSAYEPDLALSYNNQAYVSIVANKMEIPVSPEDIQKAEPYLQEALEIWQRYAAANPNTYNFYVGMALYNLGVLEYKRNQPDAARPYFEESLAIFEAYPHCTKEVEQCRDALAKL